MKIDYPEIDWDDIQDGDKVLIQYNLGNGLGRHYYEVLIESKDEAAEYSSGKCFLIDRPQPVFPQDYGTLIIAKKVRGIEFPDGIPLVRQRGSYSSSYQGPMWKSFTGKISGADNHGERQIEDWILAKVVPA